MTRAELYQLRTLRREVERRRERLKEIESAAERTTQQITGMPRGTDVADRVGTYAAMLAELRDKIAEGERACLAQIIELEGWINAIEDSETRQIMEMRYIRGWTWQRIATAIKYSDEATPRKKAERYMRRQNYMGGDPQKKHEQ